MLKFFIKYFRIFKSKTVYKKHFIINNSYFNENEKKLIKKNKDLLLLNQVPINKIRFVFLKSFTYDIDKDIINPEYILMLPVNEDNGYFDKKSPIIEIGKPENFIVINTQQIKTYNNYIYLKELLKITKKGIVIYIGDNTIDDDIIYVANLDEEIAKHKITELTEIKEY